MGYSWKESWDDEATDHITAEILNLKVGLEMGRCGKQKKTLSHTLLFILDTSETWKTPPILLPHSYCSPPNPTSLSAKSLSASHPKSSFEFRARTHWEGPIGVNLIAVQGRLTVWTPNQEVQGHSQDTDTEAHDQDTEMNLRKEGPAHG
jgi:hypothetical protein